MPPIYKCSFCGKEIKPGTGVIYVLNNGVIYRFCSKRCRLNMLEFKRDPRKFKWTVYYVKGGIKKG